MSSEFDIDESRALTARALRQLRDLERTIGALHPELVTPKLFADFRTMFLGMVETQSKLLKQNHSLTRVVYRLKERFETLERNRKK